VNLPSKVLRKQVFVVEDDDDLRALLQKSIESLGVEVTGFSAVTDFLKANAICDLYIIDLHLPGISGLTFCRQLKSNEITKKIPVIVISGNPDIGRLATKAYANEFLLKPFSQLMISEKIQKYIL
jgi:CheY-like chemotaxis protein